MSAWHPIFLSDEPSPGVWLFSHATVADAPFGKVELRRVGDKVRYRVELGGELIGWATSLETASERLWDAFLEKGSRDRSGPPNGGR